MPKRFTVYKDKIQRYEGLEDTFTIGSVVYNNIFLEPIGSDRDVIISDDVNALATILYVTNIGTIHSLIVKVHSGALVGTIPPGGTAILYHKGDDNWAIIKSIDAIANPNFLSELVITTKDQNVYTLVNTPSDPTKTHVYINGQRLIYTDDYTVSSNQLTLYPDSIGFNIEDGYRLIVEWLIQT